MPSTNVATVASVSRAQHVQTLQNADAGIAPSTAALLKHRKRQ
jgi:hypothetical protein